MDNPPFSFLLPGHSEIRTTSKSYKYWLLVTYLYFSPSRFLSLSLSQGDDVCALEKELSLGARMKAADAKTEDMCDDVAGEESSAGAATPPPTRRHTPGEQGGQQQTAVASPARACSRFQRKNYHGNIFLLPYWRVVALCPRSFFYFFLFVVFAGRDRSEGGAALHHLPQTIGGGGTAATFARTMQSVSLPSSQLPSANSHVCPTHRQNPHRRPQPWGRHRGTTRGGRELRGPGGAVDARLG